VAKLPFEVAAVVVVAVLMLAIVFFDGGREVV